MVIPVKNASESIAQQLQALAGQDTIRTFEVIVADNGSTDCTREVALEFQDGLEVRLIDASSEGGAAFARNMGARSALGQVLLFCDADDIVSFGWVDALASALVHFDAVGGYVDYQRLNGPLTRAMHEPLTHLDRLGSGLFGYLPRAVGANLGVRAQVFHRLGGFDTDFKYLDDSEFCLRVQVAGYSLGFAKDAVVNYRHRPTPADTAVQIYRWSCEKPQLWLKYRRHGARRSWGVRTIGGLLLRSWWVFAGRERRLRWYSKAVRAAGRAVGSAKRRTWYV